jgi:pyruvate kinase
MCLMPLSRSMRSRPKDRKDLDHALSLGVDYIALSFVQKPEDVAEARKLIDGRAAIISKIEKPSAVTYLSDIIALSDAVMVARGDLGVELPPEDVPAIQKQIVRQSRAAGKPVIVATQMLESMISSPTPTRAEASDVAGAVYDGADSVMLSAETASGSYPVEAVTIMDRICRKAEQDPLYRTMLAAQTLPHDHTAADAITSAAKAVAEKRAGGVHHHLYLVGINRAQGRPRAPQCAHFVPISIGCHVAPCHAGLWHLSGQFPHCAQL